MVPLDKHGLKLPSIPHRISKLILVVQGLLGLVSKQSASKSQPPSPHSQAAPAVNSTQLQAASQIPQHQAASPEAPLPPRISPQEQPTQLPAVPEHSLGQTQQDLHGGTGQYRQGSGQQGSTGQYHQGPGQQDLLGGTGQHGPGESHADSASAVHSLGTEAGMRSAGGVQQQAVHLGSVPEQAGAGGQPGAFAAGRHPAVPLQGTSMPASGDGAQPGGYRGHLYT